MHCGVHNYRQSRPRCIVWLSQRCPLPPCRPAGSPSELASLDISAVSDTRTGTTFEVSLAAPEVSPQVEQSSCLPWVAAALRRWGENACL